MQGTTISGKDSRAIAEAIRDRVPFKTYGSFSGEWHTYGTGRLDSHECDRYYAEVATAGIGEAYVVYSYATPIAWWTPEHGWHKVTQRFSVTTSKHQGRLYLIGE